MYLDLPGPVLVQLRTKLQGKDSDNVPSHLLHIHSF